MHLCIEGKKSYDGKTNFLLLLLKNSIGLD